MFRKPKAKNIDNAAASSRNIRRRMDEEPPIEVAHAQKEVSNEFDEQEQPYENFPVQQVITKSKHTGLSFNEDEGDDVVNFKLKKHKTQHKHAVSDVSSDKTLRKHRALVEKMERLKAATPINDIKTESDGAGEPEVVVSFEGKSNQQEKCTFRVPDFEKESNMTVGEAGEEQTTDAELRGAFPSTFSDIPDAKAVYEARKKREMMRQVGGVSAPGEFIPLDDTVRLKGNGNSGERARLVREDENDMSDEEDTGSFYSAKKLLQNEEDKRREEQAHFLQIEQGGSDEEEDKHFGMQQRTAGGRQKTKQQRREDSEEEEDELQRWEREQIRKGVSSNKMMQMQDELNATSMHFRGRKYLDYENGGAGGGEAEMEIDMDVEMLEVQQQQQQAQTAESQPRPMSYLPIDGSGGKPALSLDDILEGLEQRLQEKQELRNDRRSELTRVHNQSAENTELVHKLEHEMPQLESKFRMFQDVRMYTRDLLDCLNEKIVQINALDEKIMEMWKQRTERLIKRRRRDIQDQYERCRAAASGRAFMAPSEEFTQRETEREARRSRRRMQREQRQTAPQAHYEGLSSDDEETNSQEVFYHETLVSVQQSAQDLFVDTEDDFCRIDQILPHLLVWLAIDPHSFEGAYVPLCLPKLLGPFVRLQMLHWRPLKNSAVEAPLYLLPWYSQLLTAGLNNSGLADLEHPVLVQLIPTIVEKIVFPKIARIVREQWDPLSLNESTNLAALLRSLVDEYPVANADSKRMQDVLEQVRHKILDSLEHDMFVPFYSKEAIEAAETGCAAFVDRQFWRSIKLMRSILCFRSLLSDACLEELLLEGLVNRYTVLALQFSDLSSPATLVKCRTLIEQIPSNWLPPVRPTSYQSFAMMLKRVVEAHHQSSDRKFIDQAQKFVDLTMSSSTVKEEHEEANGQ